MLFYIKDVILYTVLTMKGADRMKRIVLGVLAHVDAGKTTLSEAMLYNTGTIRTLGRVDNGSSFLDNYQIERKRGITVFSKQAVFCTDRTSITLLDTPGHVDFSSEMERTLQVLDYAILLVSARDGVNSHTEALWKLLRIHNVPTFIFVNKMDLEDTDKGFVLKELQRRLSPDCIDFTDDDSVVYENIAVCDENALEEYEKDGKLCDFTIGGLIDSRRVFPCFFGSALKNQGIDELISAIDRFTAEKSGTDDFSATVFKINRDTQGNRLTFIKVTGGELRVKMTVSYLSSQGAKLEEKINMIRLYSGQKYESVDVAPCGTVCAVLGLSETYPGLSFGKENSTSQPLFEPVLVYKVIPGEDISVTDLYQDLKLLEEEDPELSIDYNRVNEEIFIHLMGEIQAEALKEVVRERFGCNIEFGTGRIIYKETIKAPVEGVGHFEPLKHYAEVHLLLEPADPGTGIEAFSVCREDVLDKNWQRLIRTHILEKTHLGVLTGSQLTDVKITLVAGRAHVKHTEGGDFRQATYRAIRQGLMKAENILLEPYYAYKLKVPSETIGRAINDIKLMSGTVGVTDIVGEWAYLSGRAPVSEMQHYITDVISYTHGQGELSYVPDGYSPCHNMSDVIEKVGYDPEADIENTPDSVFCSHGAGNTVKWYDVEKFMHVSSGVELETEDGIPIITDIKLFKRNLNIDEKELDELMEREFGPIKRKQYSKAAVIDIKSQNHSVPKKEYYIIDGYNVIFSWDGLKKLANENLDAARHILMEILANYRGFMNTDIVLVFDGYKVKDNIGEKFDYNGIHVVYTKENETGDLYIEKFMDEIGKNYMVKLVTSDNLIQTAAVRSGILRLSSAEFEDEVKKVEKKIKETIEEYCKSYSYKPIKLE